MWHCTTVIIGIPQATISNDSLKPKILYKFAGDILNI
jgi:hypothetical protein